MSKVTLAISALVLAGYSTVPVAFVDLRTRKSFAQPVGEAAGSIDHRQAGTPQAPLQTNDPPYLAPFAADSVPDKESRPISSTQLLGSAKPQR